MSHVRTQIRNYIATLLAPVGTVYKSRVYPVAEDALPCLLLYTNAEQMDPDESAFNAIERRIEVVVEVVAQATSDLDTALDELLADVEGAIAADDDLNGLVMSCVPTSIDVSILTDGAQPIGRARLVFQAHTRTSLTDPTTVI
jgi:hypothetical protein